MMESLWHNTTSCIVIGKAGRGASGCAWSAMIRPTELRYRPRHGVGHLR